MAGEFTTTTYGKWILTGEHAVIRGYPALVFPRTDRQLVLQYQPTASGGLEIIGEDERLREVMMRVIHRGLTQLNMSLQDVSGRFHIKNDIPVGTGMGASAALCVAIARWFTHQHYISFEDEYRFARDLEHLFHGQSSGLDIAGVAAERGVYFKQGQCIPIHLAWQPMLKLSFCGITGSTSACVQRVQDLWMDQPELAALLDQQMAETVVAARAALEVQHPDSMRRLANAMARAAECFVQWGLVPEGLSAHMQTLKEAGALAVKPTGSGGGGHVISLWDTPQQNSSVAIVP